ncbi:group III truncated hemoglobin [Orrella marina]|uniref:Preprotein translocase subunit TatC n=1 Tax=Orrella marina TaxID=2163011 RepID=A0A2R4XKY5_9BURK|nr:group III truncated hemoglobin [Orrella marina]AWB34369.1 preprotein translocase subunit TatC [Orrella marina]
MSRSDLCTTEEITQMVHAFYKRIRVDEVLGPIFNQNIHDWDRHLATMVSFWSSLMIGAGTYDGTPMPRHAALPGLSADLFRRWLNLFDQTTSELPNQDMAGRAREYARRIARSLWFGYQISRSPNAAPLDLDHV